MAHAPRPRIRPISLAEVAASLGVAADTDVYVTGVTLDSRRVAPGDLFAAIPGHNTHGADFAHQAARAGAAAIITDVPGSRRIAGLGVPVVVLDEPRIHLGAVAAAIYRHPAQAMTLVGVTGTNGKTTVSAMVESGLRAAGHTTGLIGTLGTRIAGTQFEGNRTTPEATELHALLAVMLERGVTAVVMEVSSIALAEHRVAGVVFDVVAFTNLSQDHLDYHRSMEAYFAAKSSLFTRRFAKRAVIGVDDEWGARLSRQCVVEQTTWALHAPADWTLAAETAPDATSATRTDEYASEVVVSGPNEEKQEIRIRLPGAFNRANALCAYAILRTVSVGPAPAAAGIAATVVPGRMQSVPGPGGRRGIVDYAHTPDAIGRVLESLAGDKGRVIAVLGAGGDRDRSKRAEMGAMAARLADVVVITDDNPRSEDPAMIRAAIKQGVLSIPAPQRAQVHDIGDRRRAIEYASATAAPADVVVVLGKGHERGQEVGGVVNDFDDVEVLAAALRALR